MDETKLKAVISLHSDLTQLIAPATPASIRASSMSWKNWLVYVPFLALICFAVVAYTVYQDKLVKTSSNEFWAFGILAAAGLGACFQAMGTAATYIRNGTFDPKYQQVYILRIALGIFAGGILGLFGQPIIDFFAVNNSEDSQVPDVITNLQNTKDIGIANILLALVGGYSSEAVGLLLKRMSDTLVTMVRGNDVEGAKAVAEKQSLQTKAKLSSDLQEVLSLPDADKDKKLKEIMSKLTK